MVIRQHTKEHSVMTAYTDVSTAQKFARILENSEAQRLGLPVRQARARVAQRLRSSPGFLQNLRNNRIKRVPSWLMDKLKEAFIAELTTEIARLEHEIHLARQTGAGADCNEVFEAQAQIEAAKKIL